MVNGVDGFKKSDLALDCMREEVCIDEDGVWRNERSVILEEERRGNLRNLANHCLDGLFLFVDVAIVLTQKSHISLANDTFNSAKIPNLSGNPHELCLPMSGNGAD